MIFQRFSQNKEKKIKPPSKPLITGPGGKTQGSKS
jgi:hypothetical protein